MLGPVLSNIFVNDLDEEIKCTLSKFVDGMKLGGKSDTPEVWTATQWDPDRLKNWVDKNLMRFKKDKCRVLNLVRNDPQLRLGTDLLESSSSEKDMGVTKTG